MEVSIEPILGFQFGIDFVQDVETNIPELNVDLIRISLFFIWIHIALPR